MKKYLSIVLLALTVNSSFAAESDPIVDVNVVEEFGIWRVYNSGDEIYIVDSIKGRIIEVYNGGQINYYLPEGNGVRNNSSVPSRHQRRRKEKVCKA